MSENVNKWPACAKICNLENGCGLDGEGEDAIEICEGANVIYGMQRREMDELAVIQAELGNFGPLIALDALTEMAVLCRENPSVPLRDLPLPESVHKAQEILAECGEGQHITEEQYRIVGDSISNYAWYHEVRGDDVEERRIGRMVAQVAEELATEYRGEEAIAEALRPQLLHLAGIAKAVYEGTHDAAGRLIEVRG